MRTTLYFTLAALALILVSEVASAQVGVRRTVNPWTGHVNTTAVGRNPWTGTVGVRNTSVNPWTGGAVSNTRAYNPWTGAGMNANVYRNPWTGQVGWNASGRRW